MAGPPFYPISLTHDPGEFVFNLAMYHLFASLKEKKTSPPLIKFRVGFICYVPVKPLDLNYLLIDPSVELRIKRVTGEVSNAAIKLGAPC